MASVLVQVADAIKTELDGGSFVRTFGCERNYADWDDALEERDELRVDVVPFGHGAPELDSRGSTEYRCQVDVVVRYRFGQPDQNEIGGIETARIDELVELVEQLHQHLCDPAERRFTNYTAATWWSTDVATSYARNHLRELRQFTAILRVTANVSVTL